MEERREMNEQRMMTKEELESRVPRLNSILKERQEDFALEYTQKPVNNGMRRGYMFKNDSPISMAVYQREDWGLMSDAQLADLLVDLARQFDVKEKSEEIAKTVNGILTDRLSGGVGGASALLLSSVWESAAKLFGTEKIIFFALSNCELMAVVAEERIIHALKSGLFDAARESVPVEEYFPKSIYGLVPDKSGYSLHRF